MNIEERITKRTNLIKNDSLSSFDGYTAQQSNNVYQIFYDFISDVKPSRILEIGTALGGFTEFLNIIIKLLNLDTKILSYDIIERPWYCDMIKRGIDVRVENIFNNTYSTVNKNVIDFINESGVTIILCDGGWKTGEFRILSKYLKIGDFIMAHDYSESNEIFENEIKNKIWNWCEITEDDIKDSAIENNLIPYNQNKFAQAVWMCKQKIL